MFANWEIIGYFLKANCSWKKFSTDSKNQSSDNAKTTFCRIITNIKTSVIRYSFILHWVRSVFSLLCPFNGLHCNFLRQIRDEVCFLYFYVHTIAQFSFESWNINSYMNFGKFRNSMNNSQIQSGRIVYRLL